MTFSSISRMNGRRKALANFLLLLSLCDADAAFACGGSFRFNFFRSDRDMAPLLDRLSEESRTWLHGLKPAHSLFFSRSPALDYSTDSIAVSLERDRFGRWHADVTRSKGSIALQAKDDYLAGAPITFDYDHANLDEASCPALATLSAGLVERSQLAASPEWRTAQGDDGTITCSSLEYTLVSDVDPKMDLAWGNGEFNAYTGWVHGALSTIEHCLKAKASP